MFLNNNYRRALSAFISDMLSSFKKTFTVVFIILAVLPVISFATLIYSKINNPGNTIMQSTGILTVGFVTVIITLSIAFFVSTSKSQIYSQFIWPVNRNIYALGNFIVMLACSAAFVSGVSILLPLEVIPAKILKLMFSNVILVNVITIENFLAGFWISICYIMLASSFFYCAGMYFFRNKIIVGAAFLLLLVLISNSLTRSLYIQIFKFIFTEQSLIVFSIKAWFGILLLHALAYVRLKRMEVRV